MIWKALDSHKEAKPFQWDHRREWMSECVGGLRRHLETNLVKVIFASLWSSSTT